MRRSRSVAAAFTLIALVLAFVAAPASAKQVSDYYYSGEYFDGSGSEGGAFQGGFENGVAGLVFDNATGDLVAAVGGEPGRISRFTASGAADPFSGAGLGDTILLHPGGGPGFEGLGGESRLAIDNSGGPDQGSLYLTSIGGASKVYGFNPDGTSIPGFQSISGGPSIAVDPQGDPWLTGGPGLREFSAAGAPTGEEIELSVALNDPVFDSEGNIYGIEGGGFSSSRRAVKLDPTGHYLYDVSQTTDVRGIAVDPSTDNVFTLSGNTPATVTEFDPLGAKLTSFGEPDPGHSFEGLAQRPNGIAVDPQTHDVWVANRRSYSGVGHVEKFVPAAPITVPTATTAPITPTDLAGPSAALHGTLNPDGVETTDCHFDWGTSQALSKEAPCAEGSTFAGSADESVSVQLEGLKKGVTYYYRLSAHNANGHVSTGATEHFIAQEKPLLVVVTTSDVNTDGVRLNADVDPNGGHTTYRFEWGTQAGVYISSTPQSAPFGLTGVVHLSNVLTGLTPNTTYHYRIVTINEAGETDSPDRQFTTFLPDSGTDACPNALVRQQTGASLLLDCRAYELASAPNTGGYDVESDLVRGQTPLVSSPQAKDRLLYSVHQGQVPGVSGAPTNYGRDPYLATRTNTGWTTEYVGLPSDSMAQKGPFGSPLLEADASLDRFAFGGTGICFPCFPDGSTNIPLREPDGTLVQGMEGSRKAVANPSGVVRRHFSADGSHFVFATTAKLETAGKNGLATVYERDLTTGATQVVSTLPNGTTIGGGQAEGLDLSSDGSRVLIGQRLGQDPKGNSLYHLYLHLGTNPKSVDLTPGATAGVLFDGMAEDGSRVFFTTTDHLLPAQDTDESADIYEAQIDRAGIVTLTLVSVAASGPSNDDSCQPPGIPDAWNSAQGEGRCNALAFAGGVGLARQSGDFYFLSPELLDGPANGEADQANLYHVAPNGVPDFVATIDSSAGKPGPEVALGLINTFGSGSGKLYFAVDNSGGPSDGDLYVAEKESRLIRKYDHTGQLISTWAAGGTLDGSDPRIFEIDITGGEGHWSITVDGQETAPLQKEPSKTVTRAEVQEALDALPNVDPGDISVFGQEYRQAAGRFFLQFGGQYATSLPDIHTTNIDLVSPNCLPLGPFHCEPLLTGEFKGPFGHGIGGIAVDNSGNLDVGTELVIEGFEPQVERRFNAVYQYDEAGNLRGVNQVEMDFDAAGLAVGPSGREFFFAYSEFLSQTKGGLKRVGVNDFGEGLFEKFAHSGDLGPEALSNVAATADGDIFAATNKGSIFLYDISPSGQLVGPLGEECDWHQNYCQATEQIASGLTGLSALAVNSSDNHVFADLGDRVQELDDSGEPVGNAFGIGLLNKSGAVAYGETQGEIFASRASGGKIARFRQVPVSWKPIDLPAIDHAVDQAATQRFGDFQVTPDGHFAAFASPRPLQQGFDNVGHSEIYRFDAQRDSLACVSCAPTGAAPAGDTALSPYGLNLTDDGHVFFTSAEPYVLRDTNQRNDAYEWSGGKLQLISTGHSPEGSSLLSVSSDGTDAFFFTREVIVHEDENGNAVKIYDARAGGGFLVQPTAAPCAASDECHGPGSKASPLPNIPTLEGHRPVQNAVRPCRRDYHRKHGTCAKKPHKRHRHPHRHHG